MFPQLRVKSVLSSFFVPKVPTNNFQVVLKSVLVHGLHGYSKVTILKLSRRGERQKEKRMKDLLKI
jgi:hypothetical protein